jgi:hypothetical protein
VLTINGGKQMNIKIKLCQVRRTDGVKAKENQEGRAVLREE